MMLKIFHKTIKFNYTLLFIKCKYMNNQSLLRNKCLEYDIIITNSIIHFFNGVFLVVIVFSLNLYCSKLKWNIILKFL